MSKPDDKTFDEKLAEYKNLVILRQTECTQIADVLEKSVARLSMKAKRLKTALIILGTAVATKASLDLAMIDLDAAPGVKLSINLVFTLIGSVIALIAAFEAGFRYEGRSGELRVLASQCRSNDRQFMSDYKVYVDRERKDVTLAKLEALIDLQNKTLDGIRQRIDSLGVDLSGVKVSYQIES